MHLQSIIWDFNGTILNDLTYNIGIINSILQQWQLKQITSEYYRKNFGFPVIHFYRKLGFDVDNDFEIIAQAFIKKFDEQLHCCHLNPGVSATIQKMQLQNIDQYILSAMEENSLRQVVDKLTIDQYFRDVRGVSDKLGHGKLSVAKEMLDRNNIDPQKTVFLGDTDHDAEVAKEIGCHCILVSTGHQAESRLRKTGCHVLSSVDGVFEYLNERERL